MHVAFSVTAMEIGKHIKQIDRPYTGLLFSFYRKTFIPRKELRKVYLYVLDLKQTK